MAETSDSSGQNKDVLLRYFFNLETAVGITSYKIFIS